jgi:hypothetical protein
VVARRRPHLCVARPSGVDDVASVTVLGLPARVKDPLPDWRAPWVGGAFRRATRVYRCFGALRAPVIPRAPLLTDAGRRAFGLLNGRLSMSTCASQCRFRASSVEGAGMARSSVTAATSFWLARRGVFGLSM